MVKGCPKLRALIAVMCTKIGDEAIIELAAHCPNLEVINLKACSLITDEAIVSLAKSCTNLTHVCLSNCTQLTDSSLLALGQHCHKLRTLEVARCSRFTDHGYQALAKNCHFMENLDLEENNYITDNTITHLSAGCPLLQKLVNNSIHIIPFSFIHTQYLMHVSRQLKSSLGISINLCLQFRKNIYQLIVFIPLLYQILSHCELITDEGIRNLSSSACACQHLTFLDLDNCPLISDTSLAHLATCNNLRRIELYDCALITRTGIRRLTVSFAPLHSNSLDNLSLFLFHRTFYLISKFTLTFSH